MKTTPAMISLNQMVPQAPREVPFSTAETEMPSYNATYDSIPPECASDVHGPDVL